MARPAISDERVIIEGPASIRIKLKSAWADGTHSLLFTPSEFLERLVALIPAPKFHTTRYYGVHARVARRIPWAQLLKRTFKIDVLKCDKCGGRMKLVAVVFLKEHGIYILENIDTGVLAKENVKEFMFVLGQARIKGAVQMIINPVAMW